VADQLDEWVAGRFGEMAISRQRGTASKSAPDVIAVVSTAMIAAHAVKLSMAVLALLSRAETGSSAVALLAVRSG